MTQSHKHMHRGGDARGRVLGMADVPPRAGRRRQAMAAQQITHRGAGGPGPVGLALPQDRAPCRGPPGRMSLACRDHGADERCGGVIGAAARRARAHLEVVGASPQIALALRLTGVATDTVQRTQLCA
jgi:hypothetical protein